MKRARSVAVLLFSVLSLCGTARAEEEVSGTVLSMNEARIVVQVPREGTRRFDITKKTHIFLDDMPAPIKRILPHSKVRVLPKGGDADAIHVTGVPK